MPFEAVIGLELHIEMKTKSKMFSSGPVSFGSLPNTMTLPTDLAFPGTMPVVNKQAVINAIRVSNALNMSIDNELWFDRKNYFYSDLPKGYQITQQARPIGSTGYIDIKTSKGIKRIRVERLHLEEDTCKQVHYNDCSLLDYNRAGIPLIEIVTEPDIRSGEEAMRYVEKIRSIVTYLDVSDGKMEEGSLRCDVNISVRPVGSKNYGTKVEIKNLNSITNVEKAIEYETKRQEQIILSGGTIEPETRRFDEASKETVLMRIKTVDADYKYFVEPNIPPIRLSKEFIEEAIKSSPELPDSKYQRYQALGLSEYDINQLLIDCDISNYFDEALKTNVSPKLLANWIIVDVQAVLNKENISINEFKITPNHLGELVKIIEEGKVSNKQAREIFNEMLISNASPYEIIKKSNTEMISDENAILTLVREIIDENPQVIIDYKNGKDRAVSYIVGIVMKKSKGMVNPSLTNRLVIEELKRR